jgi:hypothetical protein
MTAGSDASKVLAYRSEREGQHTGGYVPFANLSGNARLLRIPAIASRSLDVLKPPFWRPSHSPASE